MFVAAYAEFLSDRHQIPSSEFNSKKHRTRYASLLWEYGVIERRVEGESIAHAFIVAGVKTPLGLGNW